MDDDEMFRFATAEKFFDRPCQVFHIEYALANVANGQDVDEFPTRFIDDSQHAATQ